MKNLDPWKGRTAPSSNEGQTDIIWLDNQDIQTLLHISARTLQKWRDEYIIPFYKVCGKIWYLKSELDELLLKSRVVQNQRNEPKRKHIPKHSCDT